MNVSSHHVRTMENVQHQSLTVIHVYVLVVTQVNSAKLVSSYHYGISRGNKVVAFRFVPKKFIPVIHEVIVYDCKAKNGP